MAVNRTPRKTGDPHAPGDANTHPQATPTPPTTEHSHTEPPSPNFRVANIPVDQIDVAEQMIRHDQNDDSIIELAASIRAHGLLQPIGVTPTASGRYQLRWGARRLAATLRLREPTITARIYADEPTAIKSVALVENLQRRNMTLAEECDAVYHLHHVENRSPDQISDLLSVSRAWVLRRLSIPSLPPELRDPVLEGTLAIGAAETIAILENPADRALILSHALASKLSVTQVRAMVETLQATPEMETAIQAGLDAYNTPAPHQTVYLACAACNTPRPLNELTVIRVCSSGCTASPTTEESHDNGSTGRPTGH